MSCHTPPHPQPECCALGSGLLSDAEANRYATTFKVLGDPARLTILSHQAAAGCPPTDVTALTEMLGRSQSTVSYHLKKLCDAGLLHRRRHGRRVVHEAVPDAFADLRGVLQIG